MLGSNVRLNKGEHAMTRTGGCFCGTVRYATRGEPIAVAFCHCTMCRRSAGAPVTAWAMFPTDSFSLVQGKPAIHASSPGVERSFCGSCGTQLAFTADFLTGLVDVTLGSFDDPASLSPQMHVWESKRLPWVAIADALPRHAELPPRS
jgi:hypothetical protein